MRAAAFIALWLAVPAYAQDFSVSLGGKQLGQLSFAATGKTSTLTSTLDNTPLGVFNGTFTGKSTGSAASSSFSGDSKSSRKNRAVRVEIAKSRATSTAITPADELTDLSEVSRVPDGVMDPVRMFAQLLSATRCPKALRMYDGRRVASVTSAQGVQSGDTLTCAVTYKVVAGPGHLSPLGISTAKMQLRYDTGADPQTLKQIRIASGIFKLSIDRLN